VELLFLTSKNFRREGEEGRKKITQLTRYGTVGISIFQSIGIVTGVVLNTLLSARCWSCSSRGLRIWFYFHQSVILMTAGTVFMMWLGEQITEKGIGNGISLIIFINIINQLPFAILDEARLIAAGSRNIVIEIVILAFMVMIIAGIVLVTQGTRRIPVQYAKRVVGRKVYGGVTQYIPLRVNTAGVMPIIFAQAIMFIPSTISSFFPDSEFMQTVASYFDWTSAHTQ
jgi:preprotein translocase subunit SecY